MSTPHYLTYKGRTQTMAAWAREFGVDPACISQRLRRGLSEVEALAATEFRPSRPGKKRKMVERPPCVVCGVRQTSKDIYNHRDPQGEPCISYVRGEKVSA